MSILKEYDIRRFVTLPIYFLFIVILAPFRHRKIEWTPPKDVLDLPIGQNPEKRFIHLIQIFVERKYKIASFFLFHLTE